MDAAESFLISVGLVFVIRALSKSLATIGRRLVARYE